MAKAFEVVRTHIISVEYKFTPEQVDTIDRFLKDEISLTEASKRTNSSVSVFTTAVLAYVKTRIQKGTITL
jgi:hypothetical protein